MKKLMYVMTAVFALSAVFTACKKDKKDENIPVTGVTLNKETLTFDVGQAATLIAGVQPENATNKAVTWSSSEPAVATVTNGTVYTHSAGAATITVTTVDGGKTATCAVTVNKDVVPVVGVTLNKETLTLEVDQTETLIASVQPENATNKAVTWSSSEPTVATVTNGTVTAKATGAAIITVITDDGGKIAACALTVLPKEEGVVINGVRWATRNVDMPGTFAANPESAGMFYQWNRKIGWSSTNPMVNSNGGTIWDHTEELGFTWSKANDPCPSGWRVPTHEELESLAAADNYWSVLNGVPGRFCGSDENTLFLPAAGNRDRNDGAINRVGSEGYYWSSTVTDSHYAYYLCIQSSSFDVNNAFGAFGFSVRCVAE